MKKIIFIISIFLTAITVSAQEEIVKNYNETYTNIGNKSLIIENKYGSVDIQDWDKNAIEVQVTVTTKASNEKKAQELQDKIQIQFSESSSEISVVTEISDMVNDLRDILNKNEFNIDYKVSMPASTSLNLSHKYGAVYISKLISTSYINVKYGSLKADEIIHDKSKPYTEITLGYSDGKIGHCEWVKMEIKYSDVEIIKSKALILETKYSDIEINEATSVVTESKYDDYKINEIINLVVEADYSDFKIGTLSNKLKSISKYSDVYVKNIPSSFQEIDIETEYGDYYLNIDPQATYRIIGEAKYADIKFPKNGGIKESKDGSELYIKGYIGNNQAKSMVTIDTRYGDIKLID